MLGDELRALVNRAKEAEREKEEKAREFKKKIEQSRKAMEKEEKRIMESILKSAFERKNFSEIKSNGTLGPKGFSGSSRFAKLELYKENTHRQMIQAQILEAQNKLDGLEKYRNFKSRARIGAKFFDETIELLSTLRKRCKNRPDVYDFLTYNEYKIVELLKRSELSANESLLRVEHFLKESGSTGLYVFHEIYPLMLREREFSDSAGQRLQKCELDLALLSHKLSHIKLDSEKYVLEFNSGMSFDEMIERMGVYETPSVKEMELHNYKSANGSAEGILEKVGSMPSFLDFAAIIFFESPHSSFLTALKTSARDGYEQASFKIVQKNEGFYYLKDNFGCQYLRYFEERWLQNVTNVLGLKMRVTKGLAEFSW